MTPTKKCVEEALKELKQDEFGIWCGDKGDAERVLRDLAQSYLSGELVARVDHQFDNISTTMELK